MKVLLAAAWPPELRRWEAVLAGSPGLRARAVARAVGVGLVEAAVGTTRAIAEERPRAVVFLGTAGAYPGRRTPPPGTALCVRRVHLLSHAVLRKEAYFPPPLPTRLEVDPALAEALAQAAALPWAEVACPLGITSSTGGGKPGWLENLEAFAVGRAAAAAGLPFAAVVGVANQVGAQAHAQWRRWGERAAAVACDAVIAWLRAPTRRPATRTAARPPAPGRRARRSPV